MAGQEPIDLVIILKIVEYMRVRFDHDTPMGDVDSAAIMNIVNNMMPGSSFGVLFQNETIDQKEVTMGDRYEIGGQAGAVGRNASSRDSSFHQINSSLELDLGALAKDLELLRVAMRRQAETPDNDLALAEVGQALVAAKKDDRTAALFHLHKAGQWALGVATTIGAPVAISAIKSALNL